MVDEKEVISHTRKEFNELMNFAKNQGVKEGARKELERILPELDSYLHDATRKLIASKIRKRLKELNNTSKSKDFDTRKKGLKE